MSTIEIKHGDAVVTVHRRTPRSDMRQADFRARLGKRVDAIAPKYGVSALGLSVSLFGWTNISARISVKGDIPIPFANGAFIEEDELLGLFERYLDTEDDDALALLNEIDTALRKIDAPHDDALAPTPPTDAEKKASGKRGK